MAWTKARTAIVVSAAVILAAGTTALIIVHHFRANAAIFTSTEELSDGDDANYQKLTGMTPEQAAKAIFEAWGSKDWQRLAAFWAPGDPTLNDYKNYGGLQIVSLGKPFRGRFRDSRREYRGVFVPYEIRLESGGIKKWQLAIRCDNPQQRWYFDGGM